MVSSTPVSRMTDTEVDVRLLGRALLRALPWILIASLLAGAAIFAVLSIIKPTYKADAKILIESGESSITRPAGDAADTQAMLAQEGISSQVQLIRSRELALTVVRKLDLASRAEFNESAGLGAMIGRYLASLGLGKDPSAIPAEEKVLDNFNDKLSVFPVEKTRVITIEFSSHDPDLAARAANAIADAYIALQRSAKLDTSQGATTFLESEIASLRDRVKTAEGKVESYRTENDLFTGGRTGSATDPTSTLQQQQLGDLNAELTKVRASRGDAEAKAGQIRAGLKNGSALTSMDVLNSPLIQRLSEQEVALRAQIAQLSATLLPGHPRIKELNAQLADLRAQVRTEADKILSGLEAEAKLAQAREDQIKRDLAGLKVTTAKSNDAEVQLRALQREAASERELLESYMLRYRDAVARQSGRYLPVDARVISRAAAPVTADFPKKVPMTGAAIAALMLLAFAWVGVRELLSGRPMRTVSYEEALPVVPGAVPVNGRMRWQSDDSVRRIMPHDPVIAPGLDAAVEPSLAAIGGRIATAGAKRILVTTAEESPGVGRPLAAVALARTLARSGSRVILVDFRKDGADRIAMGEEHELPGFGDLYAGNASFAQVIFRDRSSSAHFIPAGRLPLPPDLGDGTRLATVLDALDYTYDHLVLDGADHLIDRLGPSAGAVVLVTETDAADPRTVRAYERISRASPAEVLLLIADAAPPPDEPDLFDSLATTPAPEREAARSTAA